MTNNTTDSSPERPLALTAAIFDFDGTLGKLNIDFSLMRRSVLQLAANFGVMAKDLDNLYTLEMIALAASLISKKSRTEGEIFREQAMKTIAAIEVEAAGEGMLLEGTREMLQVLKNRGIMMAVVTRNCYAAVSRVFPDLDEYFGQAVITRELTRNVKPHPDHLKVALDYLGAAVSTTAMIGDHPMDMKIGKEAGTYAIGVLTGYTSREDLLKAGADFVLDRASQLPELLTLGRSKI